MTVESRELHRLLEEVQDEVRATAHLTGCAALGQRVLQVLRTVPRHAFVPAELAESAYANHPLPIGHGQTISQPYIVALMTALIQPEEEDVVLEVGTGSGYQAAILSRLVKQVYSLEIIDTLAAHYPAFRESVRELRSITPVDLEQGWGLTEGDLNHGQLILDQALFMRPLPGWSDHRTPIDGLWLCGSGTHGGGGVSGTAGRNAARAILRAKSTS